MGTAPMVAAVAAGTKGRASQFNSIQAAIAFLQSPPSCLLSAANPSVQVQNNKWTAIPFDTVNNDPTNGWGGSANPTRWTPSVAGWYVFVPTAGWTANSTGGRVVDVWRNGSAITPTEQDSETAGSGGVIQDTFVTAYFNGTTDYAELMVFQNSGSTLTEAYAASLYGKWDHL